MKKNCFCGYLPKHFHFKKKKKKEKKKKKKRRMQQLKKCKKLLTFVDVNALLALFSFALCQKCRKAKEAGSFNFC